MIRVTVHHDLDDLQRDMVDIAKRAPRDMRDHVREATKVGNTVAKDYARASAGRHGKHYHRAFTTDLTSFYGFGGGSIVGEYGPDPARPQGGMSFEGGSRNQPAHNDLAKSADRIAPAFYGGVRALPGRWFW